MFIQLWSLKSELWNLNSIALYCLQLCNSSKLLYTSHWPFHILPSLRLGVMMLEFTLEPTRGRLSSHLLQTSTNNTSAILSNLCFFIISDPFFPPFKTSNLKRLFKPQTSKMWPMAFDFTLGPFWLTFHDSNLNGQWHLISYLGQKDFWKVMSHKALKGFSWT